MIQEFEQAVLSVDLPDDGLIAGDVGSMVRKMLIHGLSYSEMNFYQYV